MEGRTREYQVWSGNPVTREVQHEHTFLDLDKAQAYARRFQHAKALGFWKGEKVNP